MKILLDAHMLGEQEGGNETYIAGLLQGFDKLPTDDRSRITALYNPNYKAEQANNTRIQARHFHRDNSFSRLFKEMPAICKSIGADLLHATYNVSPFLRCPYVVTVHDVIFRLYPEYFSPRVRLLLSTLMPISMWRAKAVITVSEASKQDILRFYPFVRNKIIVTPEAAGPIAVTKPDPTVIPKYTNGKEFILAVGTVQPRKNIVRLVQAYILLRQRQATNAQLVIVGRSLWQGSEIQRIAAESLYSQDIIFTGYLDDASVAALYQQCLVFVYPSVYEGFGLPVLEAMALGAPVITSSTSSLPAVAGDAALLVDPYAIEQISAAIERILNDHNFREDMRRRGLQRAAQFTWEQTAAQTMEAYKWALQGH